jgi:hypothetical protein
MNIFKEIRNIIGWVRFLSVGNVYIWQREYWSLARKQSRRS